MAATQRRPFRHFARKLFRWFRIFVWLFALVVLLAGIYLQQIGLPGFLKTRLLKISRNHGVEMEFSRARLRWYRGLVFENLRLHLTHDTNAPLISAQEAEFAGSLALNSTSRWHLSSVKLQKATVIWNNAGTGAGPLIVSNLTAALRFHGQNATDLERLSGEVRGIRVHLSGEITNLAAFPRLFRRREVEAGEDLPAGLARLLGQMQIEGTPELKISFRGDLAELQKCRGEFRVRAAAIASPWATGTNIFLEARLRGESTNSTVLRGSAAYLAVSRGAGTNLTATIFLSLPEPGSTSWSCEFYTAANAVIAQPLGDSTNAIAGDRFGLSGYVQGPWNIPRGWRGNIKFHAVRVASPWAKARLADAVFDFAPHASLPDEDEDWSFWKALAPTTVSWELETSDCEVQSLQMDGMKTSGRWNFPDLKIPSFKAKLYDGEAFADFKLNVTNRVIELASATDFDAHRLERFLTPVGQRWLAQFTWDSPPLVRASVSFVHPAWTNRAPDWRGEVLPTLQIDGDFDVEKCAFRKIPVLSATTDFHYSNRVWTLPNLHVLRPEGELDLRFENNDSTRGYRVRLRSSIDPGAVKPLFDGENQTFFNEFSLAIPPHVLAEIRGRWDDDSRIGVEAAIAATNLVIRGAALDTLTTALRFTNGVLTAEQLHVTRADREIRAESVELDFPRDNIAFTNVYGTIDPHLVTDAIGSKASAAIAPYRFDTPPTIHLNGTLPMHDVDGADLHFDVSGENFHVWKLAVDRVSGKVDWVRETLSVTEVEGRAYAGGSIAGHAFFDFRPTVGTDFHFDAAVADISLQALTTSQRITNQLEGVIGGQLAIVSGNTKSRTNWNGYGRANLRDGFIWEIPIFGIFSPVLNAIAPGVGKSKAREASMNFVITNSVVHSDDLEIRASMLRLLYRGDVDLEQQVNATVEAELLRDTWMVGRALSLALTPFSKLFEYRVTGSLRDPVSEPLHIPRFLMMTLRPFHSLKKMLPEKPGVEPAPP